ncbi:unnamed protein product [Owenia fusiformis]|uniref:Uncharacterized protein n=1 Tax=Owenia fusiformis TaxID=6347 RepID=A0A8J1U0N1_OWEFU|nr:unnamed protein product [Owenia fusiformis]
MPTDVETLMEMGFPKNRAEKALAKTNFKGVQNAMDWLFNHMDDADIDDPYEAPKGHTLGEESKPADDSSQQGQGISGDNASPGAPAEGDASTGEVQQPKSLKCDECGKLLSSENAVQMHAARSGHQSFSESTEEIKPLTEEEKKAQLEKLQEIRKQKRLEKQEKEKRDQLEREIQRRKFGKEVQTAKQTMAEKEMKKLAEERRREKMEEKIARQKVKEQIEKDKRDRAAKFAKTDPSVNTAAPATATAAPPVQVEKKEYDTCRIQIRLTNGTSITQSFQAKESLAAVRLFVEMNRTDEKGPFTLMTSFPKKVFTDDDMEKPLQLLGLVPSAVLIVTKK